MCDLRKKLQGLLRKRAARRIFPSSLRRGGCAIKKMSRSILSSRRRGGVQPQENYLEFDHHPVRSIKEASRYFVKVASTPPQRGGDSSLSVLEEVWRESKGIKPKQNQE